MNYYSPSKISAKNNQLKLNDYSLQGLINNKSPIFQDDNLIK